MLEAIKVSNSYGRGFQQVIIDIGMLAAVKIGCLSAGMLVTVSVKCQMVEIGITLNYSEIIKT